MSIIFHKSKYRQNDSRFESEISFYLASADEFKEAKNDYKCWFNDKLKIVYRKHFSAFLLNISYDELNQATICSNHCSRVAVKKCKNCKRLQNKFSRHGVMHIYRLYRLIIQ